MFDTPAKLKNFMIWCKKNKIKAFKNKEIEFELSELSFVETNNFSEIKLEDSKSFSEFDNMSKEEQDELMYWSTKG